MSPPEASAHEGLRRAVTWSVGGPVSRAVVAEVRTCRDTGHGHHGHLYWTLTRGVVSHTHPVLEAVVRHTQEGAGAVVRPVAVVAVPGVGSNSVVTVARARGVAVTLGWGSFNTTTPTTTAATTCLWLR